MKMKQIYVLYKQLVHEKFSKGTYMPLMNMSTQMYLCLMYIEESVESTSSEDVIKSFLELTDFVGVHYLFQQYCRIDFKKPQPLITLWINTQTEFILNCTRWLRERQGIEVFELLRSANEFIGAGLKHFSDLFGYDYYKLLYLSLAINGVKMLTREKLYEKSSYNDIIEEIGVNLVDEFLEFIDRRIDEMKFDDKEKMRTIVHQFSKGVKSW
jgi:hypothetical protein